MGVFGNELHPNLDDQEDKCLDDHGKNTCQGKTEYRYPLSATGKSFPRCEYHWDERLVEQERINDRYPDSDVMPSWFDPSYAGETW